MNQIFIQPGDPNDDNRTYLPEEIRTSRMVVNENGNNSQVYPERLKEFKGPMGTEDEDVWYEYVPASYDSAQPTALVVSCHGGLMTGWGQAIYTSWTHVADREGFICVFPNAHANRLWTLDQTPRQREIMSKIITGLPPVPATGGLVSTFHDVRFITALIEEMKRKYNIDPGKVFIQGMSMGNAMTSMMARNFGWKFAGAAGSGCPTDREQLFRENGEVIEGRCALDVMVSRLEHDQVPPYMGDNKTTLLYNYHYWKEVNGCEDLPQISIRGDYNLLFLEGSEARFTVFDVKNRDHGQTFDDAELVWDYCFSGVKRDGEKLVHTETSCLREGDSLNIAAVDGGTKLWLNNQIVEMDAPAFIWQKLKYHGLNGDSIVRGSYLYVPIRVLAKAFDAAITTEENGNVVRLTLVEGTNVQFAKGSIGTVVDNRVEAMICEAVERDGELYIPMQWFLERFYGLHVSECEGVTYATDHPARISTYTAWILEELLK